MIVWSDIKSTVLGSVTYCYEKPNEFSNFLQGNINLICKKDLICEVCYGLSTIFLQIFIDSPCVFPCCPKYYVEIQFLIDVIPILTAYLYFKKANRRCNFRRYTSTHISEDGLKGTMALAMLPRRYFLHNAYGFGEEEPPLFLAVNCTVIPRLSSS
jgi:hypothetical protein